MAPAGLAPAPVAPAPVEGRCAVCGGWVVTVPAGTPWARGRCGNRKFGGLPGRKCPAYAEARTFRFTARTGHQAQNRIP